MILVESYYPEKLVDPAPLGYSDLLNWYYGWGELLVIWD